MAVLDGMEEDFVAVQEGQASSPLQIIIHYPLSIIHYPLSIIHYQLIN
jgi:hypothetical protein